MPNNGLETRLDRCGGRVGRSRLLPYGYSLRHLLSQLLGRRRLMRSSLSHAAFWTAGIECLAQHAQVVTVSFQHLMESAEGRHELFSEEAILYI